MNESFVECDSKKVCVTMEYDVENQSLKDSKDISNDEAVKIMERYREGKALTACAAAEIRHILCLNHEKVDEVLIRKASVPDSQSDAYELAVRNFRSGTHLMSEAKADMITRLDNFIYYVIENRFNTFKNLTKDLYQEGVVGILKGFDTYNPLKSKPTTYFYIYIVHEMTDFINMNVNRTSTHYAANIIKVKKAISLFEYEGRDWSVKDIAQETGISAETILQSIKIMESANEVHYDTVDYLDSQMSQRHLSPEEEYIKNESSQIIRKAVSNLGEMERSVILLRYGLLGEEKVAYKDIADRLGLQLDKVKKLNYAALRKLRKSKMILNNFNNLVREEKSDGCMVGLIPIKIGDKLMQQLERIPTREL